MSDLAAWTAADFPLPTFSAALNQLRTDLVEGCGVAVLGLCQFSSGSQRDPDVHQQPDRLPLRTAFTDTDGDPEERRHLLRIFLCPPNGRELPRSFAGYFREVSAGAVRGGHPTMSLIPVFQTA